MQWSEQKEGELPILALSGEIDLHSSPELREILHTKLKEKLPVLVLDFSEVEYIDSSGLATLVEYYRESRPFNGDIALIGMNQRVQTIFELVRLNEFLRIYPSLSEAREALRK